MPPRKDASESPVDGPKTNNTHSYSWGPRSPSTGRWRSGISDRVSLTIYSLLPNWHLILNVNTITVFCQTVTRWLETQKQKIFIAPSQANPRWRPVVDWRLKRPRSVTRWEFLKNLKIGETPPLHSSLLLQQDALLSSHPHRKLKKKLL
jgi:hypothetical protein